MLIEQRNKNNNKVNMMQRRSHRLCVLEKDKPSKEETIMK